MIFTEGRAHFASVTVHALDHPEQEIILSGKLKVALINQTEGQEIAPWTGYEERKLNW